MKQALLLLTLVLGKFLMAHDQFVIVRHGESTHNVRHEYNADPTNPAYYPSFLTPHGIEAVKRTADELLSRGIHASDVVMAYVSPLPRTLQTAGFLIEKGVIAHDKLCIDNRLTERTMGTKEGSCYDGENPWDITLGSDAGGESYQEMKARIASFIDDINKQHPTGTVVIITHGTPAQFLIARCMGQEDFDPTTDFHTSTAGYMCIDRK